MNKLSDQCEELQTAVTDGTVMLQYGRVMRRYAVLVDRYNKLPSLDCPPTGDETITTDGIDFCPWSGRGLPGQVGKEWFEIIRGDYGLDYEAVSSDHSLVPAELLTEEWWIRRAIGPTNKVFDQDWIRPPEVDNHIKTTAPDPPPGLRRYGEISPHMCETMAAKLSEVAVLIAYLPHTREYGVRVVETGKVIAEQPIKIKAFRYCPWCGRSLPKSLRPEWEKRLAVHGFSPDVMDFPAAPPPELPTDLASDAWWRSEGL